MGKFSKKFCDSAPTESPRDIKDTVYKNTIKLEWSPVAGASSYIIYRNDEIVGKPFITSFLDDNLEFSEEYYYKISALDVLKIESKPSNGWSAHLRNQLLLVQKQQFLTN